MDPLEFVVWAIGILFIGVPFVLFGIPCIIAAIVAWMAFKS